MDRLFVISDIHGCLDQFKALMDKINYRPNVDMLILLGDYIDRGPKSKEVVEMILHMVNNEKVIALRGNHDQRFIDLMKTKHSKVYKEFLKYGGIEALRSYYPNYKNESMNAILDFLNQEYYSHIQFLKRTLYYYENDHFIFVHAGLNPKFRNWRNQPSSDLLNIREPFIYNDTHLNKIIIFGHTPTSVIHNSADIWFSKDKIGIDGGCALGQQLNCLEILNENEFKQHQVFYNDI